MFLSKQQVLDWLVKNQEEWPTEFPRVFPRGLEWLGTADGFVASWDNVISHSVTEAEWLEAKQPKSLVNALTELSTNLNMPGAKVLIDRAIDALTWHEVDCSTVIPEGEWLCRTTDGSHEVFTFSMDTITPSGKGVVKAYRRIT